MGIAIPQVIAEDRASGAQVIDGSLTFDRSSNNYLKKTISTTGNQRTFTVSAWFKQCRFQDQQYLFTSEYLGSGEYFELTLSAGYQLQLYNSKSTTVNIKSSAVLRDTAWYHIVVAVDTTISSPAEDRVKFYINGERQTDFDAGHSAFPSQNYDFELSNSRDWLIGAAEFSNNIQGHYDGPMSNFYFVDGQALGPEEFGFTDPLTNTWRPKKFEGPTSPNDGTTWSSYLTIAANDTIQTPENAFDNDSFGTYAERSSGSNDPAIYTFSPPSTIRANSSVRVSAYAASGGSNNHIKITYNNGVEVTKTAADLGLGTPGNQAWFDLSSYINFPANISSIEYSSNGGGGRLSGIEIDGILLIDGFNDPKGFGTNGFYLPMDGNSPIGEDKSDNSNINDGTIWSNDVTTSNGYSANRDPGKGFDGNSSLVGQSDTYVQSDNSSGTVTWTPNGYTIDTADEILVKGISSLDRLSVVGSLGSQSNIAPATVNGITNVYTIPTNLGTLTSLTVTGNSSLAGWSGISVGGILLVNGLKGNSWTPVNFSGSSAIDKATGALPILNTVSGGNAATVGVRTDPFASNLILALPLVDTTTDASGIINSGTTSKTITAYNNAAPASDGQGNFYDVSLYLDGTDDYVETSNSSDFVVGTGDFTIEAWYNVAATQGTNSRLFAQNVNDDNNWDCYLGGSYGTSDIMMHGGTVDLKMSFPTANAWHHFCIVRKNGTLYSFMNGVLRHTQTYTNSVGANNHGFRVGVIGGSGGSTGYGLQGYVQDFRFYNGAAKYTKNFIPASTNPDILPDTPSGVSGGSKLDKITSGAVAFDGTNDILSVADSADFTFGSGDFTMEAFVYCNNASTAAHKSIIQKYTTDNASSSWFWSIYNGYQYFYFYHGSNSVVPAATTLLPSKKWTHCAVVRDGNTLRIFQDGIQVDTDDVTELTINDSSVALTIGEDGDNNYDMDGFISNARVIKGTALYTSNFTPPTAPLTNVTNTTLLCCQSNTSAGAAAVSPNISGLNNGTVWNEYLTTTTGANFRDFYTAASYPPSNLFDGDTNAHMYGGYGGAGNDSNLIFKPPGGITVSSKLEVYVGYYSKIKVNGSDYNTGGENTNLGWVTVSDGSNFTGTLTNLHLENRSNANVVRASAIRIDDSTILLDPVSAKGDAAASNFNPFNTDINTVRGQETGYATFNPLATQKNGTITLSDGNLRATVGATRTSAYASLPFVGKMYYEVTYVVDRAYVFGMAPSIDFNTTADTVGQRFIGESSGSYGVGDDGTVYNNGVSNYQGSSLSNTFGLNDCMGWAYDSDSGQFSVYKNGVLQGTFTASTSRTYYPAITLISSSAAAEVNFGQKPFKFPPPDGFQPLTTANTRPETVIARPDQYVGVTTYHGDNIVRTQKVGFKPDLVWLKDYSSNSHFHVLCDSVRGGANILSSSNDLKQFNNTGYVQGFESDGFRLGADTHVNGTPYAYVAWAWKAGGEVGVGRSFMIDGVGFSTAGDAGFSPQAIPTSGSPNAVEIEPFKASISTETGFSIVHYKGSDNDNDGILHGLKQKPDFVIVKNMNRTQPTGNENYTEWRAWHSGFGDNRNLKLGIYGTASKEYWPDGNIYGHTSPDTSIRMVGSSTKFGVNYLNDDYIMYSWHNVPGLQKFGSFAGNGDADGPFIELGFRPAIVWVKRISGTGYSWVVQDSERQKYNPVGEYLLLDSSNQFGSGFNVDFLSNGFKIRNSNGNMNASSTYIYCAWAEAPSANLYGGQSNAR